MTIVLNLIDEMSMGMGFDWFLDICEQWWCLKDVIFRRLKTLLGFMIANSAYIWNNQLGIFWRNMLYETKTKARGLFLQWKSDQLDDFFNTNCWFDACPIVVFVLIYRGSGNYQSECLICWVHVVYGYMFLLLRRWII